MSNRDGSTSTFPTAADDFAIAFPFQQDRINGTATAVRNDLERPGFLNHLGDACIRMQQYLQNRVGRSLEGRSSAGWRDAYDDGGDVISAPDLRLAVHTFSLPLTGNIVANPVTTRITMPDLFGAAPVQDFHTGIIPSVELRLLGYTDLQGVAVTEPAYRRFSTLLSWPQLNLTVMPVSGQPRQLDVTVSNTNVSPAGSLLDRSFIERCVRPSGQFDLQPGWAETVTSVSTTVTGTLSTPLAGEPFGFGSTNWPTVPTNLLFISSGRYGNDDEATYGPGAGFAFPQIYSGLDMTDQNVAFEYYGFQSDTFLSGTYLSRSGVMLRSSGTVDAFSAYVLLINEVPWTLGASAADVRTGKILKVQDVDLRKLGFYRRTAAQDFPSEVTVLTTFDMPCTMYSGQTCLYSFGCTGTDISVQASFGGGAWSEIATASDSDLTEGQPGLVAMPYGQGILPPFFPTPVILNCQHLYKSLTFTNLGTDAWAWADVRLLYFRATEAQKQAYQ